VIFGPLDGLRMTKTAAICACVSLLAFTAPQARAQSGAPQVTGSLSGGGTYILRSDPTVPTAAIELWFRAPGGGYSNATPGISRLALAAIAASSPPHGTSLAQSITRIGGSLAINVYPDIAMIGVSVPSSQAATVIRALTKTYFAPDITSDGLKTALRDGAIDAAELQFDPDRLLQDALFSRIFNAGPAHLAPQPLSTRDLMQISQADVKAFAARAFRQQNAFLTIAGGVAPGILSDAYTQGASAGSGPDAPIDSTLSNAAVDATQSAQVGGFGVAWIGPPIADPKAATAMDFIADYLYDGDHGTVATALRGKKTDTLLSGQFITLHNPGVLLVTASGSRSEDVRSMILDAASAMQTPLDAKTFAAARNAFEYHIMMQTQTPVSRADNFGWYAAEGNPAYAPGDTSQQYLKAIESLNPGYVADVARKYLQHPAVLRLLAAPSSSGSTT
jgi:predicted Zn-dependent peptidase